jgi:hypothetical protein
MWIHDSVTDALLLLGRLREAAARAGEDTEVALWRYIREYVFFVSRTGQEYRFEDYLKGLDPARTSPVSAALASSADPMSQQATSLLLRTLGGLTDPGEKQLILILIDTMNFVASSGQGGEFEDYLKSYYSDAPPALAYFETRAEAESWLLSASEPTSWAQILIGNAYFEAWYYRDTNERRLLRSNIIELFLEDFARKGLPAAVASFHTHEEAQEWLKAQSTAPMSFINIGGESYLAVRQKRLDRHSLHHVASTLKAWEEEKKQRAERRQGPAPASPEDGTHE